MKLLTKAILAKLPPIGLTDGDDNSPVIVKFFTPDSNWTWYATEYDPEDQLFFGLVCGFEEELGYFSLADLESAKGPLGLPVERDRHYGEHTLADVMARKAGTL